MPRGFNAALARVGVRILQIADEDVEVVDHLSRHVGVQVEGADHRNVRSDAAADHREKIAIGIVRSGAERGAVRNDIHAVEWGRRNQAILDFADQVIEERLIDRTARLRTRKPQRNRRPRTTAIHFREEARQIQRGPARPDARLADDLVAADIGALRKVGAGGHR